MLTTELEGEAREVAKVLCAMGKHALLSRAAQQGRALVLIAGGETTVTLRGSGKGGRNQVRLASFLFRPSRGSGTARHSLYEYAALSRSPPTCSRSQEMALAAAERLEGLPGVVLLSAGTDGTDGCAGSTALIPPALTTLSLPDSAPCLAQRFDAHARPTPAAGAVADGECAACVHCPLGSARCHANRSAGAKPWDHG